MDIEIIKEKETPLLSRKRVTAWVYSEGVTPTRKKVCVQLSKHLKVKPELTIIRHIYTRFGQEKAKVIAHIYDDVNVLKRLELKKLVEKHNFLDVKKETAEDKKEEVKTEEKSAEDKKENKKEDKKEDKKEEAKTEEKPAEDKKEEKEEVKTEEKPAEDKKEDKKEEATDAKK